MRRITAVLISLLVAGAGLVGSATPAAAVVGTLWSATCPGPDLPDVASGPGALGEPGIQEIEPMDLEVKKVHYPGIGDRWWLGTSVDARCSFVAKRSTSLRTMGASLHWHVDLTKDEYDLMCDDEQTGTVQTITGAMAIQTDDMGTVPGIDGIEVVINGTGEDLVIDMIYTNTQDDVILVGQGVFEQSGSLECGQHSGDQNPHWIGALEVVDPTLETPEGVPEPPEYPGLPAIPSVRIPGAEYLSTVR